MKFGRGLWQLVVAGMVVVLAIGIGGAISARRNAVTVPEPAFDNAAATTANAAVYALAFDPQSPAQTTILSISSATGVATTVAVLHHASGFGPDAVLSPKAAQIAILSPHADTASGGAFSTLSTVSASGGTPTVIDTDTDLRREVAPAWSADESQIYYVRRRNSVSQVVVAPSVGGTQRVLYTGGRQVEFLGMTAVGLVVVGNDSNPGRYVSILANDGTLKDLPFRLPADFSVPPQFTSDLLVYYAIPSGSGPFAAFSNVATGLSDPRLALTGLSFAIAPNDSRVAMDDRTAFRQNVSQLQIWERATRTSRAVTTTSGRFPHPVESLSWTSDASWLAVESDQLDSRGALRSRGIEVMRADGTGLRLLAPPASGSLRLVGVN